MEWAALVPNQGVIYIAANVNPRGHLQRQSYVPSMFHQLHCLNQLRGMFLMKLDDRDIDQAQHCMNYLRQMILCRGDMHMEPFKLDRTGEPKADIRGVHRCRDFNAVYAAMGENWKEYSMYLATSHNISSHTAMEELM